MFWDALVHLMKHKQTHTPVDSQPDLFVHSDWCRATASSFVFARCPGRQELGWRFVLITNIRFDCLTKNTDTPEVFNSLLESEAGRKPNTRHQRSPNWAGTRRNLLSSHTSWDSNADALLWESKSCRRYNARTTSQRPGGEIVLPNLTCTQESDRPCPPSLLWPDHPSSGGTHPAIRVWRSAGAFCPLPKSRPCFFPGWDFTSLSVRVALCAAMKRMSRKEFARSPSVNI